GLNAYLGAGPYYSYALSGEVGGVEIDFDDEEAFKRGDWTAAFAAGIQLPLGESFLFVDARYLLGLTDLDDRDDEIEIRNRAINLSAGILLPL
ncbi:MAG TPA: outer membrane beta-barrel protein, partial [Phaeodactylibacter sp.]|nr:outer membrane beta-barrel protein [Phaeodactylibacter sp.]